MQRRNRWRDARPWVEEKRASSLAIRQRTAIEPRPRPHSFVYNFCGIMVCRSLEEQNRVSEVGEELMLNNNNNFLEQTNSITSVFS